MSNADPRAALPAYATAGDGQTFAAAEYAKFYETPASTETESLRLWYARGQNFLVGYADGNAGGRYERAAQVDEYVLLIPDENVELTVEWEGEITTAQGPSIVFVPAGRSVLEVIQPGRFVLMFTTLNQDLCEQCTNAESYAQPHPNIPPFEAWPEPSQGPAVRVYSLNVPDEEGRFGRIWRCSTFMVNVLPPQYGPRDTTKLSPHHHDSFEQGSFALDGAFTHHIRWPWTSNLGNWRADDHEYCASPSLAVIPPPAIHTSRGMDQGLNQLIDIFSPPRLDFSQKPGWVLNASEYPMPD